VDILCRYCIQLQDCLSSIFCNVSAIIPRFSLRSRGTYLQIYRKHNCSSLIYSQPVVTQISTVRGYSHYYTHFGYSQGPLFWASFNQSPWVFLFQNFQSLLEFWPLFPRSLSLRSRQRKAIGKALLFSIWYAFPLLLLLSLQGTKAPHSHPKSTLYWCWGWRVGGGS